MRSPQPLLRSGFSPALPCLSKNGAASSCSRYLINVIARDSLTGQFDGIIINLCAKETHALLDMLNGANLPIVDLSAEVEGQFANARRDDSVPKSTRRRKKLL